MGADAISYRNDRAKIEDRACQTSAGCGVDTNTVYINTMLTDRQQQVLDFIQHQQRATGVIPSMREIKEHFGFRSETAAVGHVHALESKGALQRQPGKRRALVLHDARCGRRMLDVPIFGTIPAGLPADQQQENEGCLSVDLDTIKLPSGARVFALKVRGDSMINAGIFDGDIVVLEFRGDARNGDIVAALIDGETTLKRYVVQRGRPFLKAENSCYKNLIPAQELVIQGVQVALFRVTTK